MPPPQPLPNSADPTAAVRTRACRRLKDKPGKIAAVPGTQRQRLLLAAIVVVGAAARLVTLGSQSFWFDEAQLAHEVGLPFSGLWHTIGAQETSPPLYFVVAWGWGQVFGAGEVGLRSLSALLGIATIPLLYLCGRELVSPPAGLLAAAFGAASPFLIWYSQEAREYMLLIAVSALSLWGFARVWNGAAGRRDLGLWAGAASLALLTHFFAAFLIAPEAALVLLRLRSRAGLAAVAVPAVTALALLPLAVSDTSHPLGWLRAIPRTTRIQQVPVAFALNTLDRTPIISWGLLATVVVLALVILLLVGGAGPRELRGAGIAAGLAAVVILVPLVVALAGHDFYIVRALSPAWPPLAVVLGAACTARRLRVLGATLALVTLAAFGYAQARILSTTALQRPDWRAAARALGPPRVRRAIVAYDGSLAIDPLALYLPGVRWHGSAGSVRVSELDVISGPSSTVGALPRGIRLASRREVGGFAVTRLALPGPGLAAGQLGAQAAQFVAPAPADPAVLIQPAARR